MTDSGMRWNFTVISIPFLIAAIWAMFWPGGAAVNASLKNWNFVSDLIFLNKIHICFSLLLYYKIKPFRDLVPVSHMLPVFIFTVALIGSLEALHLNVFVLGTLSVFHAFFQSLGIYLLTFGTPANRRPAKYLAWFLFAVIFAKLNFWQGSDATMYALGAIAFFAFGWLSKSVAGYLFAARFFLWFAPIPLASASLGAIHGLEYLLVVGILVRDKDLRFSPSDYLITLGVLSFAAIYTVQNFHGTSPAVLESIFCFLVYTHYFFDAYSFRFQFPKQRQLILPLLINKTA